MLPIPANYGEHWLPSEHVEIHSEWQGMQQNRLTVGEPVTRTLVLTALGVVEAQLPDINSQYPDSVKIYPDQAETATAERNQTFIAQRTENIAIIPSQAGTLQIPEVRVPWFNVVTGSTEYAVLPAQTLTVLASPQANAAPAAPPLPIAATPAPPTAPSGIQAQPHWWSSSSWLLLAGWLLTLLIWFGRHRRSLRATAPAASTLAASAHEGQLWQQLQAALGSGDEQQIINHLQPWLGHRCGQPQQSLARSLQQVADGQLSQQLKQLFANRYGKDALGSEQASAPSELVAALSKTLQNLRAQTTAPATTTGVRLQPMYPAATPSGQGQV